ncbi:MAG: Ig-like domain-containing protein, partial [Nanoarchaeota archaeon]
YNKTPTPEQIEQKIAATGSLIYDASTGINYPRVDALALLQPLLTFTTAPANNSIINSTAVEILISSDVDLSSAIMEWNYPNGSVVNLSMVPENITSFRLNISDLAKGIHSYRVYGVDVAGMEGMSVLNMVTVDDVPPSITIQSPADGSLFKESLLVMSAAAVDGNSAVSTVVFNVSEENSSLLVAGMYDGLNWNASLNLSSLSEGVYTIVVLANDSFNNINQSAMVSFILDKSVPVITALSPAANATLNSSEVSFSYSVNDALSSISSCDLYLNGTKNDTATNINQSLVQEFNKSLSEGNHLWSVSCADAANNAADSLTSLLAITLPIINNQTDNQSNQSNTIMVNQSVSLNSPASGYLSSNATVIFNCSATGTNQIVNLTLYGSWNGGWHADETKTSDGTSVAFVKTMASGSHSWNCLVVDNTGNSSFALANRSLTMDLSKPALSNIAAGSITANSAVISWTTDEASNTTLQYGVSTNLGATTSLNNGVTSHSLTLSGLTSSTLYYYAVSSCDPAGNCRSSDNLNFNTSAASNTSDDSEDDSSSDDSSAAESSSSSSSAGGGGGGGSSSRSSTLSDSEEVNADADDPAESGQDAEVMAESAAENQPAELVAADTADISAEVKESGFGSMITGLFSAIIPDEANTKEYVLFALVGLASLLLVAYMVVSRRDKEVAKEL